MNWTDAIQNIYAFLNNNGYTDVINDMVNEYGVGGTPGEQFSIVCVWLARLRNHNKKLYGLIEGDAEIILEEGIKMKYFTESYYRSL